MMHNAFLVAASACQNLTGTDCNTGLPHGAATSSNIQHLLQIAFAIFGAVSVLMIVIGAFNFVNSEGDPQKAGSARNTMIYSLVGLVIAISAEAIVGFVLRGFL